MDGGREGTHAFDHAPMRLHACTPTCTHTSAHTPAHTSSLTRRHKHTQTRSLPLHTIKVEYVIRSEASASDRSPSAGHHTEGVRAAEQVRTRHTHAHVRTRECSHTPASPYTHARTHARTHATTQIRRTQRINAVSTGTTLSGLTPGDAIQVRIHVCVCACVRIYVEHACMRYVMQVRVRAVNSVGPSAYTAPVCCWIHESVKSSVNRQSHAGFSEWCSDGGST